MSRQNTVANTAGLQPPWPKGFCPNPGGRPKRKPLTDALARLAERKVPKDATGILQPLRGKRWADVMAAGLASAAAEGNPAAFKEAADRLEGRVAQPITGADGAPLIPAHDSLTEEALRILEKIQARGR
jgi:uncharacterized protein DUF5681